MASAILGVAPVTLRRWDRNGTLVARRHPGNNYRVYDEGEVRALLAASTTPEPVTSSPVRARAQTALVGRERELAQLDSLIASGERFVVVLGPPGVGKSTLLEAWALRRASPTLRALAGRVQTAEGLALSIATAAGTVIRAPTRAALTEELLAAMSGRSAIAIDEIDALDREALELLSELSRRVAVVVTSRVRPRLAGEHVLALAPLTAPKSVSRDDALESPAVSLFLSLARSHGVLRDVDDAVLVEAAAIVRRLDGLPLALELAASRASTIGLARMRRELDVSLDALAPSSTEERRLHTAIASSLARLTPSSRIALVGASLLPAGFAIGDLERLLGDAFREDDVRMLVDHSVLMARQGASSTEVAFHVHAAVREGALASAEASARATLEERHAVLRAEDAALWADDRSTKSVKRIARFEEALRSAFDWWTAHLARPHAVAHAIDLARALGRLVEALGPSPALVEILDEAIALGSEHAAHAGRRAELLFYRGFALIAASRLEEASASYAQVVSLARAGRSPRFEALALCQAAWLHAREGAMERCMAAIETGLRIASEARDPFPEMLLVSLRAQMDMRGRRLAQARRGFEHARAIAVRLGDGSNEASATGFLGLVAFDEGAIAEAVELFAESTRLAAEHGAPFLEAVFAGYRAIALHHLDDARADAAYQSAIEASGRVRSERFTVLFSQWRAVRIVSSGDLDEGRRALHAADRLTDPEARAICVIHAGHVDLAEADRAARAGRTVDVLRHEARACERLSSVDAQSGGRELRVAAAFLERTLRARPSRLEGATLVVGWGGAFFEAFGVRVDLGTRAPLRRVLWRLVVGALAHGDVAIEAPLLVEAGWPGERVGAALHRLQVALSTLRSMGLRELIELTDEGYRLGGVPRIAW